MRLTRGGGLAASLTEVTQQVIERQRASGCWEGCASGLGPGVETRARAWEEWSGATGPTKAVRRVRGRAGLGAVPG